MAISVNPVLPVLAAQEVGGVAPNLMLQQGSVVNAQVLKILSADLVRIAISSLSIDVLSEVPLQEGQTLQLAVSQTPDGVRLAVVGQGADAESLSADAVTLSPGAQVSAAANPQTATPAPMSVLTPLERIVVSAAAQSAATEQNSLAPLFANLGAAVSSGNLPPKLREAIAQVLAQQTSLDSEPRRRRHQNCVPEIRAVPGSLACNSIRAVVHRRPRSQGCADCASSGLAIHAWHDWGGTDADRPTCTGDYAAAGDRYLGCRSRQSCALSDG